MKKTIPASNIRGSFDLFNPFYEELKRSSNKTLFRMVEDFLDDLKKDLTIGVKVKKKQWPKCYIKKYQIRNLYKYDLGLRYRATYTILSEGNELVGVVIECMDHNAYNKRFGYAR